MLLPFDIISRSLAFDERANDMQLRPWQWELLLAVDGRTRLDALARTCGIDLESACDLVRETEALGLVEIVTLTLEAYRASVAERGTSASVAIDPPVTQAAPRKTVSLSFDSFSSTVGAWDVPAEGRSAIAEEPTHEADAEHPSLDELPMDFEFPNHMEPLGDRDVAVAPEAFAFDHHSENGVVHAASHEELAHDHAPHEDLVHESFADEPFTHESFAHDAPSVEHAGEYPAFDAPVHETIVHDRVAPMSFASEPASAKSVSYSLAADSFGLPVEPFETAELTHGSETALPKDDTLLQHYQVDGGSGSQSSHGGSAHDPESDTRTNADITGAVLRVLGLKK